MKHTDERDTADARYDHLWLGEVVSNDDPLKLGRVQVFVAGIYEPSSDWAFPMGFMYGVREGVWAVPKVGAQVVVFLDQGDVDHPYYMPGPFGAPGGESDVPQQAPDVDHYVVRWRQFHVVINGKPGEEKLFVEDEVSGTRLEIDRVNGPGDFLRNVEGNERIGVRLDRNVTVEEGSETHVVALGNRTTEITVGNDTETVGGDKIKTVTGSETDTITGSKTETVLGSSSTETVPSGAKTITAGLAVNVTAGLAATVQAGALLSLLGSGVTINSAGGPTNMTSGGLATNTFLGGIAETVTGIEVKTVSGTYSLSVVGLMSLISSAIVMGVALNAKKLVTEEVFALWANSHVHDGVTPGGGNTGAPTSKVVPAATGPDVELNDVTTQNVTAS